MKNYNFVFLATTLKRYSKSLILGITFMFFNFWASTLNAQVKKAPGTIIECPAGTVNQYSRMGMQQLSAKSLEVLEDDPATAEFVVNYGSGARNNEPFRKAFEFVLDIMSREIFSNVPIKINVDFGNLPTGVLASAGPIDIFSDFSGAPQSKTWYGSALADALAGRDLAPDEADAVVNIGNGFRWYYGLDGNTPENHFDMVTVCLHELLHTLEFGSGTNVRQGIGFNKVFHKNKNLSRIMNSFIVNGSGTALNDLENATAPLAAYIQSNDIFFNGFAAASAISGGLPKIYAPNPFQPGSSFGHWDEATYPAGDPNSLMTPVAQPSESNFDIGDITRGLLEDVGWGVKNSKAKIRVSPIATRKEQNVEEVAVETVFVTNTSDAAIKVQMVASASTVFFKDLNTDEFSVPAKTTQEIKIDLNTEGVTKGGYEDSITFKIEGQEDFIWKAIVRVIDGTEKPMIAAKTEKVEVTLGQREDDIKEVTVENAGDGDGRFKFTVEMPEPDPENVIGTPKELYDSSFEDLTLGSLYGESAGGKGGWFRPNRSRFTRDVFFISDEQPRTGSKHFKLTTSELDAATGLWVLSGPRQSVSDEAEFTTASAYINLNGMKGNTTFTFAPLGSSGFAHEIGLTFRQNDGVIEVLDASNRSFSDLIDIPKDDYFKVEIVLERATRIARAYVNGVLLKRQRSNRVSTFTSVRFEWFVRSSDRREKPFVHVDDVRLEESQWSSLAEISSEGIEDIPFGQSLTKELIFNATGYKNGLFEGFLKVEDLSGLTESIKIPLAINVITAPTFRLSTRKVTASVNAPSNTEVTESVTITNEGSATLRYGSDMRMTKKWFTPESDDGIKRRDYGYLFDENAVGLDSLYNDGGKPFADIFVLGPERGVRTITAIKFTPTKKFKLSAVRNAYRSESSRDATYTVEVYKVVNEATNQISLLLSKDFDIINPLGGVVTENLGTTLEFEAGESFFIMHDYSTSVNLAQGIDDDTTAARGTSFYSNDGVSFTATPIQFFVRALGTDTETTLTLEPSSGTLEPGESVEAKLTFNGKDLANGDYDVQVIFNSNDPKKGLTKLATSLKVTGQQNDIELSDSEIDFGEVFIGNKESAYVIVKNPGLGSLSIDDIQLDSDQFSTKTTSLRVPAKGEARIRVNYKPKASEANDGRLILKSNASGDIANLTVMLKGQGVKPPIAQLSPIALNLATEEGNNAVTGAVTLTNKGKAPLKYAFPEMQRNEKERHSGTDLKYGYRWVSNFSKNGPVYNYSDISETADRRLGITGDMLFNSFNFRREFTYELPFAFDFYGNEFTTVYFTPYGVISFNKAPINAQVPVPADFPTNPEFRDDRIFIRKNVIAPLWGLNYSNRRLSNLGTIYIKNFTDRVIFQYDNVRGSSLDGNQRATFQLVLYKDGNIDIFYKDLGNGGVRSYAAIGINNANNTDGFIIDTQYEDRSFPTEGTAIRIMKPAKGLTRLISEVTPKTGTLAPGASVDLTLKLDTEDLEEGTYEDKLIASTNAPKANNSTVQIVLDVNAAAALVVGDVFPNPVTDRVRIKLENMSETKKVSAVLHDFNGTVVRSKSNFKLDSEMTGTLDMVGLKQGIYIFTLLDHKGNAMAKVKLLKN